MRRAKQTKGRLTGYGRPFFGAGRMDAVCDAVEKAFLHLETLRDNRYFSSWFIRIVINECKAQLQKRQRALTLSQQLSDEPEHETPEREEVMDVQALLNQLAPLDRLLISLKFFDGYTLDEIAELTQLPVGRSSRR
jgi:RNA polymerase sigma-70 factor, ECF subfamily